MRTLHALEHADHEGPGRIAELAASAGFDVEVHLLFRGAPVPTSIAPGDALVILGGSMGVGDLGDPRWPFLRAEVSLLETVLAADRPVLGVCLGAQLLAHALGARVAPLVVGEPPVCHREVGWGAVTFSAGGEREPILAGLGPSEVVLHWHGDTFELPRGAVHLASTLACENQMFRVGRRSFGLQFHVDVPVEAVERWVREDTDFVVSANGRGGPARILADASRYGAMYEHAADRLLRNLFALWSDAGETSSEESARTTSAPGSRAAGQK
jgi:GMP synthase-like glutamine amidotransferase